MVPCSPLSSVTLWCCSTANPKMWFHYHDDKCCLLAVSCCVPSQAGWIWAAFTHLKFLITAGLELTLFRRLLGLASLQKFTNQSAPSLRAIGFGSFLISQQFYEDWTIKCCFHPTSRLQPVFWEFPCRSLVPQYLCLSERNSSIQYFHQFFQHY